jgi:hypothetical protein
VAFAAFVRRAIDHAKTTRGWDIDKIVEESRQGVSRSTIFRWLRGDWKQDPLAAQVMAFCDALSIPPGSAFGILWSGRTDRPPKPEPMPLDPDFEVLLRRLADPAVSEKEKYHIQETVRALAARRVTRRGEDHRGAG